MEHVASSPSLIALGLTAETSSEGPSFRWGLVSSFLLHALVLTLAMFIRFQSNDEKPFRTIDVALISLPAVSTPTPKPSAPPAKNAKKTPAATPQKKVVTPPPPAPAPAPKPAPVEDTLPPLPTQAASERLSESLGGAINSILVPQKREMSPVPNPTEEPVFQSSKDQSPLLENLQLPSAAPTISRPKRLQPTEPIHSPSPKPPMAVSPQKKSPSPAPVPPPTSAPLTQKSQPVTKKQAPSLPSLSEVTPFAKPKPLAVPSEPQQEAPSLEEAIKQKIPDIQNTQPKPAATKKIKPNPSPARSQNRASTPKISAPAMAKVPKPLTPQTSVPAKPKMSDTVKKLMEGLKSTTRMPTPKKTPRKQPTPPVTATTPIPPPPSVIDQKIAKLSIPDVKPVESIKQRLQLLEVQTSGSQGGSSAKPSPGKNRYLAMVEERIDRQWVAPPLLTSNPVVVLTFQISRSGEISRIRMTESSGHAHYDSSAQRAVQAVNPLPPFPSEISDSFFDVTYRFIKD